MENQTGSLLQNKKLITIVAIVVLLGGIAYFYKGLFVAATVNGKPISRLAVVGKLEAASGKQVLDSLITESLIKAELDKNNITVGDEIINGRIKEIEASVAAQGSTLEDALKQENLTMEALREQILTQARIEAFLAERIVVSDEDVNKYITDNKIEIAKEDETSTKEEIRNQLKSQKFNEVASEWVSSLQAAATIRYFNYDK